MRSAARRGSSFLDLFARTSPSYSRLPLSMDEPGATEMGELGSPEADESLLLPATKQPRSSVEVSIDPSALSGDAIFRPPSSESRCDYVLVYRMPLDPEKLDGEERAHFDDAVALRKLFMDAVLEGGVYVRREEARKEDGTDVYLFLDASVGMLQEVAERMKLEMPVKGLVELPAKPTLLSPLWRWLRTDSEVDIIGTPYERVHHDIFVGAEQPATMFRSSLRQMLLWDTLTRINLHDRLPPAHRLRRSAASSLLHRISAGRSHTSPAAAAEAAAAVANAEDPEAADKQNNFIGLLYLLHKGVFSDGMAPHEPLAEDGVDGRSSIKEGYRRWFRFQPIWALRNYYGEELALFFAWTGALAFTLVPLVLFGIIAFLYGAANVNKQPAGATSTAKLSAAFDNSITPWVAFALCLWSSVFLELWKRRQAVLAFEWDVADFEEEEPHRPQFFGTNERPNAITGLPELFYPFTQRLKKLALSYACSLTIISLVIACAVAIIAYRVIAATTNLFAGSSDPAFAISVTSSLFNTLTISFFGHVYNRLAVTLTEWENHRTQSEFNRHLIIKLFAFQFVNSYTSLFYIAFFRRNIHIFGRDSLRDSCGDDGNCMSMLSIQVLVMLSVKPLTKMVTDNILPMVRRFFQKSRTAPSSSWLERELAKTPMEDKTKDFIINDYLDRVIQYGYLTLFAAAFPLAPLLVVVVIFLDVRTDMDRYLFRSRRPIARRAESIGVWHTILEFVNAAAVVSNGFLIAFTSQYGRDFADEHGESSNLWLLVIFEHAVVGIKFVIAYLIPDVPHSVVVANRRKAFRVARVLDESKARRLSHAGVHRHPHGHGGPEAGRLAAVPELREHHGHGSDSNAGAQSTLPGLRHPVHVPATLSPADKSHSGAAPRTGLSLLGPSRRPHALPPMHAATDSTDV